MITARNAIASPMDEYRCLPREKSDKLRREKTAARSGCCARNARSAEMGEILGLGCTHYPGLTMPDEQLPGLFHRLLTAPNVPEHYKNAANWPTELVAELGNDEGFR